MQAGTVALRRHLAPAAAVVHRADRVHQGRRRARLRHHATCSSMDLDRGHHLRRPAGAPARAAGARRRRTDEHGVSALLLALYHRRPEARDALLAAGAPVGPLEAAALGDVAQARGRRSERARRRRLHAAAPGRVLRRGGGGARDPRHGRRPGRRRRQHVQVRPIHSAVRGRRPRRRVRALLEAGANPNVAPAGRLHAAARGRAPRRRSCRATAEHGADSARPTTCGTARAQPVKWTLPFERARACARSMKSSRLIAARHRRATSFIRARLRAQVEQALLGVEPELDRRRHLVGRHRLDLAGLGRAVGRLLDEVGVGDVRARGGLRVDVLVAVVEELDDPGRVRQLVLARLDPERPACRARRG